MPLWCHHQIACFSVTQQKRAGGVREVSGEEEEDESFCEHRQSDFNVKRFALHEEGIGGGTMHVAVLSSPSHTCVLEGWLVGSAGRGV